MQAFPWGARPCVLACFKSSHLVERSQATATCVNGFATGAKLLRIGRAVDGWGVSLPGAICRAGTGSAAQGIGRRRVSAGGNVWAGRKKRDLSSGCKGWDRRSTRTFDPKPECPRLEIRGPFQPILDQCAGPFKSVRLRPAAERRGDCRQASQSCRSAGDRRQQPIGRQRLLDSQPAGPYGPGGVARQEFKPTDWPPTWVFDRQATQAGAPGPAGAIERFWIPRT